MDKEKLEMLLSDVDMKIVSDLKKDLAEEMGKPAGERDENLISELQDMISETEKEIISESKNRSLESVMKMLDEYEKPRHITLYKWLSAVVASLVVFIGLNTASLVVFGNNFFSSVYQITKGGITIFTDQSSDNDRVADLSSDPYDMKAKCAKYGFFPDTPSYIPDGFVLKDISEESDDYSDSIIFFYRKGDAKLNFFFINYKSNEEIPQFTIPTDTYNIVEKEINGRTTYILTEDEQFTAMFVDKRIRYMIFSEDLSYVESQAVLESMS